MSADSSSPAGSLERRLLLVEDNPLFVEQICEAIEQQPVHWRVHAVSEGRSALKLIHDQRHSFDLVLVDLGLPDMGGIEVIRACNRAWPEMPVVVISVMASEPQVLSAIEAGAKGYILKSESTREITEGIAQVMKGVYPLSPSLARLLFKKLANDQAKTSPPTEADFKLTPRELETLRCLSQGLSYGGVAEQMGVSLATIQHNVRNLYRKLNVRSQVQAITKARDHDLL